MIIKKQRHFFLFFEKQYIWPFTISQTLNAFINYSADLKGEFTVNPDLSASINEFKEENIWNNEKKYIIMYKNSILTIDKMEE